MLLSEQNPDNKRNYEMNTCLPQIKKTISRPSAARAVAIIAFALIALLTGAVQQAQAASCEPGFVCVTEETSGTGEFDPQLVVSKHTHAYTGPGFSYLNYGDLPLGYNSRVVGINADGKWMVIPLPRSIAPDGHAWVNRDAVSHKNIRVVSEWLLHCASGSYCEYVRNQTSYEQILPDWLAHCDPQTYCGYVLAHSPRFVPVMEP